MISYPADIRPRRNAVPTGIAVAMCVLFSASAPHGHGVARASAAAGSAVRAPRVSAEQYGFDPTLPTPALDAGEFHAGERVTIHWTSLDARAEELELVFSIDDGRTYDVRVSPELLGGESRFVWRVPNVNVAAARVRLRARINGREVSGYASNPFRITSDPVAPRGRWRYRDGEWWEDASGTPIDLAGLLSRGPGFRSANEQHAVAAISRTLSADPPQQSRLVSLEQALAMSAGGAHGERALPAFRPTRE